MRQFVSRHGLGCGKSTSITVVLLVPRPNRFQERQSPLVTFSAIPGSAVIRRCVTPDRSCFIPAVLYDSRNRPGPSTSPGPARPPAAASPHRRTRAPNSKLNRCTVLASRDGRNPFFAPLSFGSMRHTTARKSVFQVVRSRHGYLSRVRVRRRRLAKRTRATYAKGGCNGAFVSLYERFGMPTAAIRNRRSLLVCPFAQPIDQ